MNVLKPHLQTTIWTLLAAGASQREIERVTGIDRKTIRGYLPGVNYFERRVASRRNVTQWLVVAEPVFFFF